MPNTNAFVPESGKPKYNVGVSITPSERPWGILPNTKLLTDKEASASLAGFLRTDEGVEFALASFAAAGVDIDSTKRISLDVQPVNFGQWAGILKVSRKVGNRPAESIIVNLARGEEQAGVVEEDFRLMQQVHSLIPENSPAVYESRSIVTPTGKLSLYSMESLGSHYELHWWGGFIEGTAIQSPIKVDKDPRQVEQTTRRQGEYFLSLEESTNLLVEMVRLQAQVFIGSGENMLLTSMVNNGDFISLYRDPSAQAMQLITARGNMFDKNQAYAHVRGADPIFGENSRFGDFASLSSEAQRVVVEVSAAKAGISTDQVQQMVEQFEQFPSTLTRRQHFLLSLLFHFETFVSRDSKAGSDIQIQFWPANAIVEGINRAIVAVNNPATEEETLRLIHDWWHGDGQENQGVDSMVATFSELMDSPFARVLYDKIISANMPLYRRSFVDRSNIIRELTR